MQSQAHQHIEASVSPAEATDDDGHTPFFVVSVYPNGLMTVAVEGSGDKIVDGEVILSFHEWSGVEIGHSSIFAEAGEASMLLFKGTYEEQRDFFCKEWVRLAEENERPDIFDDEGLEGLARLNKLQRPPLPEIDEEATAHTNEVLRAARERMPEFDVTQKLTLADCVGIASEAGAEMGGKETPSA